MIEFGGGWEKVKPGHPGEFVRLPAGGYVCIVTGVVIRKANTGSQILELSFDIAEGDFAQHFKNARYQPKFYQPIYRERTVSPYFLGLLTDFVASNTGVTIQNPFDETTLINKKIGAIFGDEEREYNGRIYTDAKPRFTTTVDKIRAGDYKVPPIKRLQDTNTTPTTTPPVDDDDDDFVGEEISDSRVPF